MRVAITRGVSPAIGSCELTYREREPVDLERARQQHREYEQCLADLGCTVVSLPAEPDLPDSVFVEDTAVVLDELALLTRPGAASRRAEIPSIATVLGPHCATVRIEAPATLDGGDVLVAGRTIYVGRSTRSNEDALNQMRDRLAPYGYSVVPVPLSGCLHLKSAVTLVADDVVLVNPAWVDAARFVGMRAIEVDPREPEAANTLRVGEVVVVAAAFGRTLERVSEAGLDVVPVDLSELAKAEGAVTCCSLVFESSQRR